MGPNVLSKANQSQLLIIDVQEKLLQSVPGNIINSVIKNINAIQEMALLLEIPTLITEQYPKGLGATDPRISNKQNNNFPTIEKTSFSCCQAQDFNSHVNHEKNQIIIVGMESHICVLQTALQLQALNKQVFVIEDASCSRNKHNHQNAISRLSKNNIIISNTESLLFEWLEDASHPHFKTASRLIR
ncbi:MAG: isochorismatase family protein [Gammaproteobacteria bacterium]